MFPIYAAQRADDWSPTRGPGEVGGPEPEGRFLGRSGTVAPRARRDSRGESGDLVARVSCSGLRPALSRRALSRRAPERPHRETSLPAQQSQASQAPWLPPPDVDPCRPCHPRSSAAQGAGAVVGLTAAGVDRVRSRARFVDLSRGRRARRGPVTVTWAAGDPSDPRAAVAYAISRRAGGAVVRNRIRRRLRAVVRDLGTDLPAGTYLLSAGAEAATLPYTELRATVSEAVHAATGRAPR